MIICSNKVGAARHVKHRVKILYLHANSFIDDTHIFYSRTHNERERVCEREGVRERMREREKEREREREIERERVSEREKEIKIWFIPEGILENVQNIIFWFRNF